MSTLEEKAHAYGESTVGNSYSKYQADCGYRVGYKQCQKEYEEKLRWIPVEEKLPESHKVEVMFKTKNGGFYFGFYGLSCNFYAMLAGLLDENIHVDNVTHWRLIL